MQCEYFGVCGSCTLYNKNYEEQLNFKISREKERFSDFTDFDFEIIKSEKENFRIELSLEFGKILMKIMYQHFHMQ